MSRHYRRSRGRTALVALTTVTALTAVAGTAMAAPVTSQEIPGSVPRWASPANDSGAASADSSVEGEIYLPLRDQAGAQALATAVFTPHDPRFGQHLSPRQHRRTAIDRRTWALAVSPLPRSGGAIRR